MILGRWTLEMVVDANDVIDAFEEAAAEAAGEEVGGGG